MIKTLDDIKLIEKIETTSSHGWQLAQLTLFLDALIALQHLHVLSNLSRAKVLDTSLKEYTVVHLIKILKLDGKERWWKIFINIMTSKTLIR
jgi:hypothetical protein